MLRSIPARMSLFAVAALAPLTAQTTPTYIPQIADGAGWRTTIVVVNSNASIETASLSFFQDIGNGQTTNWTPPLGQAASFQDISLTGGATLFLHTAGTAADLTVGWARLDASPGVTAYAIFTQTTPHGDQDGTADGTPGSSRLLVPFDNTGSLVTSAAFVNPTSANESVSVGLQIAGNITQLPSIGIPAGGHLAFTLPQQFPATAGQKGVLEFYSANNTVAGIALRFNPTEGFTTSPVYEELGAPTIAAGGGSNSLPIGKNAVIVIHPELEANSYFRTGGVSGLGGLTGITMTIDQTHSKFTAAVTGIGFSTNLNMSQYDATFVAPVTCAGNSCTFSNLYAPASLMYTAAGTAIQLTSGTISLTFTPRSSSTGTVLGSLQLQSGTTAAWGSTIKGTYDVY